MDKLQITIEKQDENAAIINLQGTLDITNYLDLQKVLRELLDYKVEKIIVNLSGLEYMSSAGAGVFVEAVTMAQGYQGSLVLVASPPKVKATLDLLKVSEFCHLVNNIEEALNDFD